jgi:hypothetical protein
METNELRLGNWIKFPQNLIQEQQLVYIDARKEKNDYSEPIPITEKWLLNFGFEDMKEQVFCKEIQGNESGDYDLVISKDGDDWDIILQDLDKTQSVENEFTEFQLNSIKFVHQLQNLYFVLTGNELQLLDAAIKPLM